MKKLFLSLAALVMTMSAPMMTSCSSDLEEVAPEVVTPETGTHEETLTIAFPEQAETRVAIDGSYNLTGWEEGDEVTLVQTWLDNGQDDIGMDKFEFASADYTFRCTNAENGTFTGTLPNGVSVNDCQLAFYNATGFETYNDESNGDINRFYFSPKKRASQNMKDVVMMAGRNDGYGHFEMKICGSILKATNKTGADITASVKFRTSGYTSYYYSRNEIAYDQYHGYENESFRVDAGFSSKNTFTLSSTAPTYVYIPVYDDPDYAVGLSAEDDATNVCSIVPFKTNPGNAKLFKKTLMPIIKGTAKRTGDIDVTWVQLWEDGPKFAEYNVGVTDGKVGSYGGYYAWGGSQDKVDDHNTGTVDLTGDADTATKLWGSAWRMPTKAELRALLANCDVEWTTVNGVNGCKFTGKGDFDSNSVFLPAAGYYSYGFGGQGSLGYYWSSTPDGSDYAFDLFFRSDNQYVGYGLRYYGYSVRAVLAE